MSASTPSRRRGRPAPPRPAAPPESARTTFRPTRLAAVLFALSLPLALLVVTTWPGAWYVSFYWPILVLAFGAADLSMARPGSQLAVDLLAPGRIFLGRPEAAGITLQSPADPRPLRITALLELTGPAEAARPVSGLMTGGRLELNAPIEPTRRGRLDLAALWLRWRGPLGLVELRRRQSLAGSLDVLPDTRTLARETLPFFDRDALIGLKSQRLQGEGAEFDKLGDYTPGRDYRFIDWKRSARHRKLLVKEFRQERNHQIVLGFDTGHLMLEPVEGLPKLDHAIRAGLQLAWLSLRGGDLVGGCGFDAHFRSFIQPGRGSTHFGQFQRFTADLDYRTEETNFTLGLAELGSRLRRRALVILFTEFVDPISAELLVESLARLTRRHLVVCVTLRDSLLADLTAAPPDDFAKVAGAVIADGFARERAIVLERVARLGVHVLETPVRELAPALLNRYLMIKQRGLL